MLATVAGIGAAVLVGGWLVQQAFASGPPEVVIACLTVVDPIVAVLLGAMLLGEGAATPARPGCCWCSAAVAATAGVVALARHHPDAVRPRPNAPPRRHRRRSTSCAGFRWTACARVGDPSGTPLPL